MCVYIYIYIYIYIESGEFITTSLTATQQTGWLSTDAVDLFSKSVPFKFRPQLRQSSCVFSDFISPCEIVPLTSGFPLIMSFLR